MRPERDPIKWADEWPLPGISGADRKRIKAILLMAHAAYHRSDQDVFAFIAPMEQAFGQIAKLLFDAGLLTVELLNNELRLFVIESASAGYWIHFAEPDEGRAEIFPGFFGSASAWKIFNERMHLVFRANIAEWTAKLLEREADQDAPQRPALSRFKPLDESYQTIEFDGRHYELTTTQSTVVRVLHQASIARHASVGMKELYRALGTNTGKMSHWFRGKNKNLYGKLIVQTASRDHYRLDF